MEVQVNVSKANAEKLADKNAWSDNIDTWWNIRVPKNAKTEPEWRDYELKWDLEKHYESIGMTGWDWQLRASKWVAFDFDSITNHAKGVGLNADQLDDIRKQASSIPWVQVYKSTSGNGLHFYTFFDEPVPCANHTIHAALARSILGLMSEEAGFDFSTPVDCYGGNVWFVHRNNNEESFYRVKKASRDLGVSEIPKNWEDNQHIITGKRQKLGLRGVKDSGDLENLANSRNNIALEPDHKKLRDYLQDLEYETIWNHDLKLLQTHTCALKRAHETQEYVGFFDTISSGSDPSKPNCFMFPLPNGAWRVYRYSKGSAEHESWELDDNGLTCTYFNQLPNLRMVSLAFGGIEKENMKGFEFDTFESANKAISFLGAPLDVPGELVSRETHLNKNSDGRLVVNVQSMPSEPKPAGWTKKRGFWSKLLPIKAETSSPDFGLRDYDNLVRCLSTPDGQHVGFMFREAESGNCSDWQEQPKDNIKLALLSKSMTKTEAECTLGTAIRNPWTLVNVPFGPEYPGSGRAWNYRSPQLRVKPSESSHHPTWDMIFDHVFEDLDGYLQQHPWAQKHGVLEPRTYGQMWLSAMIRYPFEKLPYLFLFGPSESGKSTLHEAIEKNLIKGGVVDGTRALTNTTGFNGEFANAVLVYVEEDNIRKMNGDLAKSRMRTWTTGLQVSIRKMRTDSFMQASTLHFIQCSETIDSCLVSYGDTRITMLYVKKPTSEIPKEVLQARLEKETPDFLHTLMTMDLPEPDSRLRIPCIQTSMKSRYEELTRNALDVFLSEQCFYVPGNTVTLKEFCKEFESYRMDDEHWSMKRVASLMPPEYPVGKSGHGNTSHVGNLSFSQKDSDKEPWIAFKGRLRLKGEIQ